MRRLNINLDEVDSGYLDEAARLGGGHSITEVIRHALHLYAYVRQVESRGGHVAVMEEGQPPQRLMLL
jgi:hypothetical protein